MSGMNSSISAASPEEVRTATLAAAAAAAAAAGPVEVRTDGAKPEPEARKSAKSTTADVMAPKHPPNKKVSLLSRDVEAVEFCTPLPLHPLLPPFPFYSSNTTEGTIFKRCGGTKSFSNPPSSPHQCEYF